MTRILVVGGNGFIGSHVVDALSANDKNLVSVFKRADGAALRWAAPDVRILHGDFLNEADVRAAVRGQEIVLHFVSTTDPATAENDPSLDIRTNITSSVALFQACVDAGVERVGFASTGGAIYGDHAGVSAYSELHQTRPVSPYAIGKLAIENYLSYFNAKFGLQSVAFRISNPYGTRQSEYSRQGVIPIFLRKIAEGAPLMVYGDGTMVRDYIFVEDVATMIASVIHAEPQHPLYNIGSGRGYTVNEIVDSLEEVTATRPAIEYRPTPATFVDHVTLDISRFATEFGQPRLTGLSAGLQATWKELVGSE